MSQFPHDDDPALKEFLQQHRPPVPPPSPGLEDRLLEAIATAPTTIQPDRGKVIPWRRRTVVPRAIAASLIAGLIGYHLWLPQTPNPAETENLEAFLEANWQNTVASEPDSELFTTQDPATH